MIHRRGFSLFEILISVLILVVGILTIMALLPASIKAQQMARYQLYASAAMLTMNEAFHNAQNDFSVLAQRNTGDYYSDNPSSGFNKPNPSPGFAARLTAQQIHGSAFAPNFEQVITSPQGAAIPVPLTIARRLDSDNDEIGKVLDQGGALFYLNPSVVRGNMMSTIADAATLAKPAAEFQRLVFAVMTPPQQNALNVHPMEPWPHYDQYPFPPKWRIFRLPKITSGTGREPPYMENRLSLPIAGSSAGNDVAAIDPGLVSTTLWTAEHDTTEPCGLVHGANWKFFHDAYLTYIGGGTNDPAESQMCTMLKPWHDSWGAFKRLAGDTKKGWYFIQRKMDLLHQMPTLDERRRYRDRALYLWSKVKPVSIPLGAPTITALTVDDSDAALLDTNEYEFPDTVVNAFKIIDPRALGADFPPHPAQVLALSYLAHAGLMVTGDSGSTAGDLTFAQKAHTMCLSWAVAYARENPYEWGAPRPAGTQTTFDKPLVMQDLFYQTAETLASSRVRDNDSTPMYAGNPFPSATNANWDRPGSQLPFYRWIEGPNPALGNPASVAGFSAQYANAFRSGVTHPGIFDHFYGVDQFDANDTTSSDFSKTYPRFLSWRTDCSSGLDVTKPNLRWPRAIFKNDNASQVRDLDRFWITRSFATRERAREVVFWAVDWKNYEDAETAPSSPVDMARSGYFPLTVVNSTTAYGIRHTELGRVFDDIRIMDGMSMHLGNPEGWLCWEDMNRTQIALGRASLSAGGASNSVYGHTRFNTALGAAGADRNLNGRCDIGQIPKSSRLTAVPVARFTIYDPVMRLGLSN